MPLWLPTIPMGLTLLRLALVPVFLTLLFFPAEHLTVIAVAAIMAVTDVLDGRLARRWNQTSRVGLFLDPVADKILVASTFLLLSFRSLAPSGLAIPWPLVAAVYIKDLGVIAGALVIRHRLGRVEIRPNRLGKLSTATQLALLMVTLVASDIVRWSPGLAGTAVWALWWATLGTTAAAGMSYGVAGAGQIRAADLASKSVECRGRINASTDEKR